MLEMDKVSNLDQKPGARPDNEGLTSFNPNGPGLITRSVGASQWKRVFSTQDA